MLDISTYDKFFSHQLTISKDEYKEYFKTGDNTRFNEPNYYTMIYNFSRFWYNISKNLRLQYLMLAGLSEELYDELNKVIMYVYDISFEQFDKIFFDGDCANLEFNTAERIVLLLYKFKYNICAFWNCLTLEEKTKFINLIDAHEFKIKELEPAKPYDYHYYKFAYKRLEVYSKFQQYKSPDSTPIRDYTQADVDNFKHGIKKLDIIGFDKITSLDNLPETVEELYIGCPKLKSYDNLPQSLKILRLGQMNDSCNLNNLPNNLEDLDVSNNGIKELINNIPPNLKILKSVGNNIEFIEGLSNSLIYLNLTQNLITKLENLPTTLLYLKCKNNKIELIENLPPNLEYLDLSDNKIKSIGFIPPNVKYLDLSSNSINIIDLTHPNILYLNCSMCEIKNVLNLPTNLEYLNLDGNSSLDLLNCIPNSLKYLSINGCEISELVDLPNELIYLNVGYNKIQSLQVPESVEYLDISNTSIKHIDLPKGLVDLKMEQTSITEINLPEQLLCLDISFNNIPYIKLPPKLQHFDFLDCNFKQIENYSDTITMMCCNLDDTRLKYFPNNLMTFYAGENENPVILPFGVSIRKSYDIFYRYIHEV